MGLLGAAQSSQSDVTVWIPDDLAAPAPGDSSSEAGQKLPLTRAAAAAAVPAALQLPDQAVMDAVTVIKVC